MELYVVLAPDGGWKWGSCLLAAGFMLVIHKAS
jgi:hypothetical protein